MNYTFAETAGSETGRLCRLIDTPPASAPERQPAVSSIVRCTCPNYGALWLRLSTDRLVVVLPPVASGWAPCCSPRWLHWVQSPPAAAAGLGQLLVRPDQVRLGSPTKHHADDGSALTGHITDAHFQGDHCPADRRDDGSQHDDPPSPVGAQLPAAANGSASAAPQLVVHQIAHGLPTLGEPVGVTVAEPVQFLAD